MDNRAKINSAPCGSDDPGLRFLQRFSSTSADFESQKQTSLESFHSSNNTRNSDVWRSENPNEIYKRISEKLWSTVQGWKMREFYVEMLCILFPSIEELHKQSSNSLVTFLQKVFRVDQKEHLQAVKMAKSKTLDEWVLNLEIIEAKNLPPTDLNGLSDPFCILSLNSRKERSFRTKVEPKTLNPVWNAFFTVPVTSCENDILTISVWDFDPEERTRDKFKRIVEIKSSQSLKQYFKDLKAGRATQEFIGDVTVPIKEVESEVIDKWFPLNNDQDQGEIRLRMALGTNKDKVVAINQYKQIYQLLLIHDLERVGAQMKPFTWNGTFPKDNWTIYILRQMSMNCGLKPHHIRMAEWLASTRVHLEFPLNLSFYADLLKEIFQAFQNNLYTNPSEYQYFWKSLNELLRNFALYISNDYMYINNECDENIRLMLKIVSRVKKFCTLPSKGDVNCSISESTLTDLFSSAITSRATTIFESLEKDVTNKEKVVTFSSEILKHLSTFVTLLQSDLDDSVKKLQKNFETCLGLNFFDMTYKIYDSKSAQLLQPVVEKGCKILNETVVESLNKNENYINLATNLFKLYIALKQFAEMSKNVSEEFDFCVSGLYHKWFHPGVKHWWEQASTSVAQCMERAVNLEKTSDKEYVICDTLQVPVSQCIIAAAPVYYEIQMIWRALDWPSNEEACDFIVDIVTDLWYCTLQYAKMMSEEADAMFSKVTSLSNSERYTISRKVCVCVNNIKYIMEMGLHPVIKLLKVDDIIRSLANDDPVKSEAATNQVAQLVNDYQKEIDVQISNIFQKCARKMYPEMLQLLQEASVHKDVYLGMNEYISYMDINLSTLKLDLTPCSFDLAFRMLWSEDLNVMEDLIQSGVNRQKPPEYFQNLYQVFGIMKNLFHGDKADRNVPSPNCPEMEPISNASDKEAEIDKSLDLHKATVAELKLKYYRDRFIRQATSTEHGLITVKVQYIEESQRCVIEVLSARNLKSYDSDGQSDPYVDIHIVPQEMYKVNSKMSTGVRKSTLFPLFDEKFTIQLSLEDMERGGYIAFCIFDYDYIGKNDFHGEAFLPLSSIPRVAKNVAGQQQHLNIDKPSLEDIPLLEAMEKRADRVAARFVKDEKSKMDEVHRKISNTSSKIAHVLYNT